MSSTNANHQQQQQPRNLRDHLLAALAVLPGTRQFHLHVLVSSPRKCATLFPFAKPRMPKVYVQDILVLLSEEGVKEEVKEGDSTTKNEPKPRTIVTAIEANVYTIASTSSAIFYVSKVDSTGQASAPSPTATLVRALLKYYLDPATSPLGAEHIWVQLFARAQSQYLFANSSEYEGKKWLTDTKLCAWWRRVLTRVVAELGGDGKMYYILPGYSEEEAEDTLRIAGAGAATLPGSTKLRWHYGHPYSQKDIPLPCPQTETLNLGHFIPWFDDDPKARFLDEIAYTTEEIKSPQRKRARTMDSAVKTTRRATLSTESNPEQAIGELGKVTADDFWERMSFRQECIAGAVTGFFTVIVPCQGQKGRCGERGLVSAQINKRVLTTLLTGVEFSTVERAMKATETVEGAIKGLCEGLPANHGRRTPEPATHPLEPPRTPPRNRQKIFEESPSPFPEPVASLETYVSDIYGTVLTRNAVQQEKEKGEGYVGVRMLNVRRKIKK